MYTQVCSCPPSANVLSIHKKILILVQNNAREFKIISITKLPKPTFLPNIVYYDDIYSSGLRCKDCIRSETELEL